MPLQLPVLFRTFSANLCTVLNFGIIVCTIVESYVFPFAIIKWMIIVTKYGGFVRLLRGCSNASQPVTPSRSRYEYSLQVMTSWQTNNIVSDVAHELESHVNVVVEVDNIRCNWIQVII